MGIIFAIWRRFFGGFEFKDDSWLGKRGLQMIFCIAIVTLYEWLAKGMLWYIALIVGVLVYIFWCKGHWYYFQCGMESDKYIDEELAKGRKPCMNWLVQPINKWLGFAERSKRYCFVGLLLRYFIYSLPVSLFIGWQFAICGFVIPFIYNACYWVDFPKCFMMKSPTNWAEFFSGLIIGWALW